MKKFNKLVRDRIPEIIENSGKIAQVRILPEEEYLLHLEKKLDEEVGEYHRDQNLEELADVLEVVYALADRIGTRKELMDIFEKKHRDRGGFSKGYFLVSTTDEGE
jgi:predicted house-cleaning noncanonical NTP pyrophosphatase (MazG superfamily)